MINFEEELKNFKPSLEVEEAEAAINNRDLADVTDIINDMMKELKEFYLQKEVCRRDLMYMFIGGT